MDVGIANRVEETVGQTRVIVIGNEKGGAGKSTLAIHLMTALLHEAAPVAVIDLDLRQQSLGRFLQSRRTWGVSHNIALPMPLEIRLREAGPRPATVGAKAALFAFHRA